MKKKKNSQNGQPESGARRPGPRTPQGKQRSRYNAVAHGIFADIVLAGEPFHESTEDYERLLDCLRESFPPGVPLADVFVEELGFSLLRLSRILVSDAQLAPLILEGVRTALTKGDQPVVVPLLDKQKEVVVPRNVVSPDLLLKYERAVQRAVDRALERLERLRANSASSTDATAPDRSET